ncbi:tagaturonate reductase [Spirosoma luteum]|uniref:tagaturonate reductase n=1 Tax=Spirosoma luteum TaxID=431553 RepID=UPI00035D1E49|nr:tagaturonate reductase [Spirosoma luteum]
MTYLTTKNYPHPEVLDYPEKALFFGTGVLLRGLPLFFIEKANRQGVFRGRVVVVKSTTRGDTTDFDRQENCFTTLVRGIENGREVNEVSINCAISRVLTASTAWAQVLAVAESPALSLVVSNTTEVGIQYVEESIFATPPASFPAKLLAVLHKRYETFSGDPEKGLVIVPTELISENGDKLRAIVQQLALFNNLSASFIIWLNEANDFCNSLVDRIVPGLVTGALKTSMEAELGYQDDLMIMAEPYRLWAIEGNERVRQKLTFAAADAGVKIEPSITKFKELKLRLLNAPHTLCCSIAHLMGFVTVKEAMKNVEFLAFMRGVMFDEISPCLGESIEQDEIHAFANAVLDRFRNENLDHKWLSISMNYTAKMAMRCVGLLEKWYQQHSTVPAHMAFAFASYLYFMRVHKTDDGSYAGFTNGASYSPNDPDANVLASAWETAANSDELTRMVLTNSDLWSVDLSALPGFSGAVSQYLNTLLTSDSFTLPDFTPAVH